MIHITRAETAFERLPLKSPFGFKGRYVTEIWHPAVLLQSDSGNEGLGLGVQSVLWSDGRVFAEYGENSGNCLMFLLTDHAVRSLEGRRFSSPPELLASLFDEVYSYGRHITGNEALAKTFALNALVPVDNALWQLYCRETSIGAFSEMIPTDLRAPLASRQRQLAAVPLITYGMDEASIRKMIGEGYFFLKIKIGSDPEKDGDVQKMVDWDKQRLSLIHRMVKDIEIPFTENGHIPYYFDANGRYPSKEVLQEFLRHAEKEGALERIILLEEPFPEELKISVADLPVRLAADESAHSEEDVRERISLGYGAIALKPIAKTMSVSLKMVRIADDYNVPCFCADLTVTPIMVDWNKNVAARLRPLPGMKIGVLETNGHQNYRDWETLLQHHPKCGASWTRMDRGIFNLDDTFYRESGGILETSNYYRSLFPH